MSQLQSQNIVFTIINAAIKAILPFKIAQNELWIIQRVHLVQFPKLNRFITE